VRPGDALHPASSARGGAAPLRGRARLRCVAGRRCYRPEVLVVVGSPIAVPRERDVAPGGLPAGVAIAAASLGADVQIVGRVGEDAAGDDVLLGLAAAGVGHVAVLREASRSTPAAAPLQGAAVVPDGPDLGEAVLAADEPDEDDVPALAAGLSLDSADLELALRYLPDYRVVVLASDLDPAPLATVVAAAAWSGAHLVALVPGGSDPSGLPVDATILERPANDPDGAFARLAAAFAVALDRGVEPDLAFREASRVGGWASVAD
jgi:hypothetical protein